MAKGSKSRLMRQKERRKKKIQRDNRKIEQAKDEAKRRRIG